MSVVLKKRAVRVAIDLKAIEHNLNLARQCSPQQKLFAVIKADAYGHGAVPVAQALDAADGFAVVTVSEAIELRNASIDKPILVLQGAQASTECQAFLQHGLWPVIHCEEQLQWFTETGDMAKLQPWIKIDTGMGRFGFLPNRAQELLSDSSELNWFGALTHFACADESDNPATSNQIQQFFSVVSSTTMQKSLANSAGVLGWPAASSDWARPGIMLYGSNPLIENSLSTPAPTPALRPAMRVSAPLISCKHYPAGASIGYGASYVCPEPMTIGYVAIGYGDGLPRVLDKSAVVWVDGHQCSVLGRVSMDSIAINLSGVNSAKLGTEVVLWGPEQPIEVLAKAANTISYELMTSIKGLRDYS